MCGICGLIKHDEDLVNLTFHVLLWLQHRGQESAGIAVYDNHNLIAEKWRGRVDLFGLNSNGKLSNSNIRVNVAIGHNRYSNTGEDMPENYQPFIARTKFGKIAIAHNGNLVNAHELRNFLCIEGFDPDGTSDSELIALLIAHSSRQPGVGSIEEAIQMAAAKLTGSFSLVIMAKDRLIGLRDPWGIRPLSFARFNDNGFIFASETSAMDVIDAELLFELNAGELVVAYLNGEFKRFQILPKIAEKICIFEYIYFALPSSIIHGRYLKTARRHMGEHLWEEHPVEINDQDDWVVGGIPDTGVPSAEGYAEASGLNDRDIMIKNRYVGRTFIQPNQKLRELGVKIKLKAMPREINGRKVVATEDSIVRGTTTSQTTQLLRKAGAKEVHMRISSPPYCYQCPLGTDTQKRKELIAAQKSIEEIRQHINADSLGYLSLAGVINAIEPLPGFDFCTGCFNGEYPFPISED